MERPNILIFMSDQQRADSIPPFGRALTPNLDRFCRDGVTFSQTFCPSPHCCPSRATFFTGLYPSEHGVWNNIDVGNALSRQPFPGTPLWSEALAAAGYQLHFSGKWHVSKTASPVDHGWRMTHPPDTASLESLTDAPVTYEWEHLRHLAAQRQSAERGDGQILRPGYGTYTHYGTTPHGIVEHDERTVADALEVIRGRGAGDGPWCQYVGTLGPHDPYFVPPEVLDRYRDLQPELPPSFGDTLADRPGLYRRTRERFEQLSEREHREALRRYLAFCSYEDDLFGRLLSALEERGELDNTLILYTSDHGDYAGDHGLWCKGLPCFRGAYHVPAAIRWPGGVRRPGRDVDAFVSLADLGPTLLDAAGVSGAPMSGTSLLPWLRDEPPGDWRDAVFTQSNGNELYGIQRSVTTREWKYVYNGFDYDELYDLRHDPHETVNLARDPRYGDVVRQLCGRLWRFAYEHRDTCVNAYIMVSLAPVGPGVVFE